MRMRVICYKFLSCGILLGSDSIVTMILEVAYHRERDMVGTYVWASSSA